MQITVTARHLDISEKFQGRVVQHLTSVLGRFANRPTGAGVTFDRDGQLHSCEVTVHLSTGLTAQAKSRSGKIYTSFDLACDKLGKQLRRYKRRLKNHHHERNTPVSYSDAVSSVLASAEIEREEEEPETLQPVIVAEMEARIPALSVGEAVMQMELAEEPLLVFRNLAHGGVNVVHRRDDGNVGWIDPGDGS